uniref:Uncharacterized protein n=1 Tax=Micromonas pusilla TaxID=38833 RepID=A0A7S0IH77_MICPS
MSLANIGQDRELPKTGKTIFHSQEGNSVKNMLYGGYDADPSPPTLPSGRKAFHGNQRTALPFATYDENENVHGNQYRSPRLHKKNSKFDVGAAKVGVGNHDAVSQQYEYERMQAQAAAMKARNQYGDGNIFGQ